MYVRKVVINYFNQCFHVCVRYVVSLCDPIYDILNIANKSPYKLPTNAYNVVALVVPFLKSNQRLANGSLGR